MIKALLVHSAFLANTSLDSERIKYEGIGIPGDVARIISCTQSAATLILQIGFRHGRSLASVRFQCHNAYGPKVFMGEVLMTLVYYLPLDRGFGFEYCRTNVNASLGTVDIDGETGKEEYNREVQPVPKELTDGFEDDLVKHGYKWSPLKLYYRKFRRGPTDKPWRLTLELLNRAEHVPAAPQDVILIITVRDSAAGSVGLR